MASIFEFSRSDPFMASKHGDDDQIMPYHDSAVLAAKLLRHGSLKLYNSSPHGMLTTDANVLNADSLGFIRK